jgi:hypothetical protein
MKSILHFIFFSTALGLTQQTGVIIFRRPLRMMGQPASSSSSSNLKSDRPACSEDNSVVVQRVAFSVSRPSNISAVAFAAFVYA